MRKLSEKQIDAALVAQANNLGAWGNPIRVRTSKVTSLSLSADITSRAAFFARLHREASVRQWLERIIRERINVEEAAFSSIRRELARKKSA